MKLREDSRDIPISAVVKDVSLKETNNKNDSHEPVWKCRYVIAILGVLSLLLMNYVRMNMSISIVAMVNNTAVSQQVEGKPDACPIPVINSTEEDIPTKMEGDFNWSAKIQGFILGSYFFGYVAMQMPAGLLVERYGSKWFLFGSFLVTGVSTLLIPSFSYINASAVIALQLLRGFAQTGLYSAISYFVQFLCTQFSAWITLYVQKKKFAGIDFHRKFWNSTACLGTSACLFGMYWSGCNRISSVIFGILANGLTGLSYSGCWIVPADMSPTFAGSIRGICCFFGLISGFLMPVAAGYMTDKKQTIEQWNKVFLMSIGVVMSTGIIFALFGSAEIQSWNFVEEESLEKGNKQAKHSETNTEKADEIEEQTRF